MAGIATTVWEFRASGGNSANGGGFDTASGGTDYSNQNSAQATWADSLSSLGSDLTDDMMEGLFTAAMVGNYINIDGSSWFRITAFSDEDNVTCDRDLGSLLGSSGKVGGALDILTDAFLDDTNSLIPGNTIHIKNDGTMTTAAINVANDGNTTDYITISGYNTSRGDVPKGSSRPTIALGGNLFRVDDYWRIENLIFTTTSSSGVDWAGQGFGINLKCTNSSGSAGRAALTLEGGAAPDNSALISCEGISTNGNAVSSVKYCTVLNCYLHDSTNGVNIGGSDNAIIANCIIDTCTSGITTNASSFRHTIINNVIYNCTTGVNVGATSSGSVVVSNILDANTTGVSISAQQNGWYMDYNVWDNSTDVTNISKGANAVTGDPGLTDPANGDFTLGSGSNAIDAGLKPSTDIGTTGTYKWNSGVDQDDVAGGGAAGHANMTGGMQ